MSESKSKVIDKTTVTIKPIAYYKMLVHILRYGSKIRDRNTFKEVMGMLIGRLDGDGDIKDVIIEDAIPITHGGSIEVKFTDEQLGAFGELDNEIWEKYGDKNWFTVGWYHSHPGLKCFFSSTDILNQLFWQSKNPSGIGIVFDHEYLEIEGDLGFRTYRLDNPNKSLGSDYHEVKSNVEPPDSLEYYYKLLELINSIHSREPPILEINETPDLFGSIPLPNPMQMFKRQPKLETNELLSSLQKGLFEFLDLSYRPLIEFLNNWSLEIFKKNAENCINTKKELLSFKENLGMETLKLQKLFKDTLNDKLNDLEIYIDDRLDEFDGTLDYIKTTITDLKRELIQKINKLFEKEIDDSIKKILNSFNEDSNRIKEINQKLSSKAENLEKQQSFLGTLLDNIKSAESDMVQKFQNFQEATEARFKEKLSSAMNEIEDINGKAKIHANNLETIISKVKTSKQQLNEKINALEAEKQKLNEKINTLEAEKQQLNAKIVAFEAENQNFKDKIEQINFEKENLQNQLKEAENQKGNEEDLPNKIKNTEEGGD